MSRLSVSPVKGQYDSRLNVPEWKIAGCGDLPIPPVVPSPQTIISCLVGLGAISSWVISQFVADAKQLQRLAETSDRKALAEAVAQGDTAWDTLTLEQKLNLEQPRRVLTTLKKSEATQTPVMWTEPDMTSQPTAAERAKGWDK